MVSNWAAVHLGKAVSEWGIVQLGHALSEWGCVRLEGSCPLRKAKQLQVIIIWMQCGCDMENAWKKIRNVIRRRKHNTFPKAVGNGPGMQKKKIPDELQALTIIKKGNEIRITENAENRKNAN